MSVHETSLSLDPILNQLKCAYKTRANLVDAYRLLLSTNTLEPNSPPPKRPVISIIPNMPSLSHLFRSRSSLKPDLNVRGLSVDIGLVRNGNKPSQAQVARLRQQVNAAQNALTELDALVSAFEDDGDEPSDSPASSEDPSSPATLSVAIHLNDMERSTKALTNELHRHVHLPQPPTEIPISTPVASTPTSDLYPVPLRLPLRVTPASASQPTYPNAPSPFHEEMSFLDWQLHQQQSPDSKIPCATPPRTRPTSLPLPARRHVSHDPQFSTEHKTQKLRSMQGSDPLLDDKRPLSMDELMAFLRAGNSMREL